MLFSILALGIAQISIPSHRYKYVLIAAAFFSMVLRFDIAIYLYASGTEAFGTDGLTYHLVGTAVSEQLKNGVPFFSIKYDFTWYTFFIGMLYHIFGVSRYMAAFTNAFMAFLSGLILMKIVLKLRPDRKGAIFAYLSFLFFPNLMFWTADTLKESLVMLLSLLTWKLVQDLCMGEASRAGNGFRFVKILIICLLIWIITLTRMYLIIPAVLGIISSLALTYGRKKDPIHLIAIGAVFLSSVLIFFLTVYPQLQTYHAIPFPRTDTQNVVENLADKFEIIKGVAMNRNIPKAFFNFMTLPHPWNVDIQDIRGITGLVTAVQLDAVFWYIILIPALMRSAKLLKEREPYQFGILVYCMVYIAMNVLLTDNDARTVYRYRCQVIWPVILLADYSWFIHAVRRWWLKKAEKTLVSGA